MKFGKSLAATVCGIGLGIAMPLLTPSAALANSATVTPRSVAPGGTITATVSCTNGGNASVQALWGLASGQAQPNATKQVQLSNGNATFTFPIPAATAAGSYSVGAFCPNASQATMATFTVTPRGAPMGGDGGRADNTLALTGAAVLLAVAAGGMVLMRRRAHGVN